MDMATMNSFHNASIFNIISVFTIASLLAGFAYIVGVILYRLTFHPLAKYPGPLLGRVTDWYSVIRSAVGDRHIQFLELHKKHGPIVRFGPNRISVNTAEGLQKIYGIKANTQKASYYHVFNDVFKGDSSLTTVDPTIHTKKKRIVSTALADKSIAAMEELVLRNVRIFTVRLVESFDVSNDTPLSEKNNGSDGWSSPKNMTDWCGYLSFDIMGDICFSGSFNMLQSEENRFVLKVLPEGVNGLNMSGWMPGILRLKLGNILFAKLNEDMKRYEAFSNQQSTRRLALGDNVSHKDVYSHLLDANKSSKTSQPLFTPNDLVGESSLLITGGSDTTATALSATIFYLLHNPTTLQKLEAEVLPRFSDVEEIRGGATLASCRWLRACIDEAMRMSPGVPGLLPREVLAGGLVIEDIHFPAGIDMGVPHYAIHHNENYYPDSFSYKPERWIADSHEGGQTTPEDVSRAQSAFCPFSIGPRGCVGKGMAMKELMITIARVVWLYEMRLTLGDTSGEGDSTHTRGQPGRHRKGEFQMRDMFVSKTDGPLVQFRPRVRS